MAKKLFVKLQSPTIEMEVNSSDPSQAKAKLIIGFKRYELSALQDKLELYNEVIKESSDKADEMLKADIVYLRNATVEVYDDETYKLEETIEVKDTRTVSPTSFWGDSKECLSVLVDHYLDSAPWKGPIYEVYMKAISNFNYEDAKLKN